MLKGKHEAGRYLLLSMCVILLLSITIAAYGSSGGSDGGPGNTTRTASAAVIADSSTKMHAGQSHTDNVQAVGVMLMILVGISKLLR